MHRRLPPLNALRAFEAAARLKSFTAAADELGVTHGAVSRQVQRLEDWLGIALFVRSYRGVDLTVDAQTYRMETSAILDCLALATGRLTGPRNAITGALNTASPIGVVVEFLQPYDGGG